MHCLPLSKGKLENRGQKKYGGCSIDVDTIIHGVCVGVCVGAWVGVGACVWTVLFLEASSQPDCSFPCLFSIETTSVSLVTDIRRSRQAIHHPSLPSVRHTDEPQQGRSSCLRLFHLCWDDPGRRSLVAMSIELQPPSPLPTPYWCGRLVWCNIQ